jgi:hypothetical protein
MKMEKKITKKIQKKTKKIRLKSSKIKKFKYQYFIKDQYELTKKYIQLFTKWYHKLEPYELNVLESFKNIGFADINEILRNNMLSDYNWALDENMIITHQQIRYIDGLRHVIKDRLKMIENQIKILDKLFVKTMKSNSLPVLFRGDKYIGFKKLRIGDEYTFKQYLSTSFSPHTGFEFLGCNNKRCLIIIHNPRNIKLPYIFLPHKPRNLMSALDTVIAVDECEILLPRNLKCHLRDKYMVNLPLEYTQHCSYKNYDKSVKNPIQVLEFDIVEYEAIRDKYKIPEESQDVTFRFVV